MLPSYRDRTTRIAEPPVFFDSDVVRIVQAWERTGLHWTRRVDCEGQRPR